MTIPACIRAILIWCLFSPLSQASCLKTDAAKLGGWLGQNQSFKEIIFFASWCSSCRSHIENASESSVLVAVFDTEENANAVNAATNLKKRPCFWAQDQSISTEYKVGELPFSVDLKPAQMVQ